MDRRKSIKTLVIGGFSIGVVAEACNNHENSPVVPATAEKQAIVDGINRMKEEIAKLVSRKSEAAVFVNDSN